jgi:SpoVK/Ycf46/Vps4 family AAA+-type ATPase
MSTRPIVTPIPESTTTGLVALVLVAGSLSGAFYRFWRPKDASAPVTSRTPQADPPAPEVVTERRIKRSGDADSDAPPTPTPPGQFTISDRDNRTSLSTNDDRKPGQVDFSELQYNWTTETDVSLEDIGGMDELKQTLQTDVIKPLTTGKEKANALGIPLPNIVFYGSPGTGKTFMAKALATELGLPFALLSGADVQSKWINESAQKINTLFEEAKTVAESRGGAVVFLDELDAVLKQRSGAGQAHEEDNKVVAEFLNHLQDTSEHDVLFIGATNRLDALDDAGIRSGRIDKKIRVGKPDLEAREAILHAQLADRPNNLTDNQVERIANRTEGLVAADLKSIVVDAARASAFARGSEVIEWEDLVETVEQYG